MRVHLRAVLAASLLLSLATGAPAVADGAAWSRFRGPNGGGIGAGASPPLELGPDVNVEWVAEVPFARSSPVLGERHVFLTAVEDDRLLTLAIDRTDGSIAWRGELERTHPADLYHATDAATSSPVTDGTHVYAFFHEAGLVSYDAAGRERWRVPIGPFRNYYGISASPILAGGTLLMLCDQVRGSYLLAVAAEDGRELWRRPRPARVESYTTPVLYPGEEAPRLAIVAGTGWIDAYDLTTGDSVWSVGEVGAGPVSSPVLAGDLLFVSTIDHASEPMPPFSDLAAEQDADGDGLISRDETEGSWIKDHFGFVDVDGDGVVSAADWQELRGTMTNDDWGLQALRLAGEDGSPEKLWSVRQAVPYLPTTLLHDGILYAVEDGILSAYDPASGELHERGRLEGGSPPVYASPVAARGHLFIALRDGRIAVLRAGADWEVLSIADLGEEIYATPALGDGRLYVRTKTRLYSFAAPEPEAEAAAATSQ